MRIALLAILSLAACTVECPEEESNCRGVCVFEGGRSTTACGYGDGCIQCPAEKPANAYSICAGSKADGTGICGIVCLPGYADCNGNPADGCEISLYTDPRNCGQCGAVCKGACTPAGCLETLADNEEQPTGLVADHAVVYWASRTASGIQVRGAGFAEIVTPETIFTVAAADGLPPVLALRGGDLILSTGAGDGGGSIFAIPRDGGTPSTIASGLDEPARMTVDGETLYWTDHGAGDVMRAVPGTAPEVVVSGRNHPREIAVDAGTVYWLEEAAGTVPAAIFALPPNTASPQPLTGPSDNPKTFILDANALYWFDGVTGMIRLREWRSFSRPIDGNGYTWNVTSIASLEGVLILSTQQGSGSPGGVWASGCWLSFGESNPDWLTIGLRYGVPQVSGLSGPYVFWVDGARIRRIAITGNPFALCR